MATLGHPDATFAADFCLGRKPRKVPTFEVLCAMCDELRWPMLPERPSRYVCARCHATPRDKKARLKAAAAKRKTSVTTA